MNRLKEFLQVEIRSSYKYIAKALASVEFTQRCVLDLGLDEFNSPYNDNLMALIAEIEEILEEMEAYLRIEER